MPDLRHRWRGGQVSDYYLLRRRGRMGVRANSAAPAFAADRVASRRAHRLGSRLTAPPSTQGWRRSRSRPRGHTASAPTPRGSRRALSPWPRRRSSVCAGRTSGGRLASTTHVRPGGHMDEETAATTRSTSPIRAAGRISWVGLCETREPRDDDTRPAGPVEARVRGGGEGPMPADTCTQSSGPSFRSLLGTRADRGLAAVTPVVGHARSP